MGERLERLWPSLVALFGTVAVVLALLWWFGGDGNDSTPDDVAAGADGDAGSEAGGEPTGGPSDAPSDGPSESPPGSATEDPSEAPTEDESETPEATTAPPELREEVGILNQTSVNGLAESAQERLEDGGWDVPAIGTYEGNISETTVYYPDGMEEAAEALSAQFPEIGRVEPTIESLNPTRLVVVLVDDYVDEVGEPESE